LHFPKNSSAQNKCIFKETNFLRVEKKIWTMYCCFTKKKTNSLDGRQIMGHGLLMGLNKCSSIYSWRFMNFIKDNQHWRQIGKLAGPKVLIMGPNLGRVWTQLVYVGDFGREPNYKHWEKPIDFSAPSTVAMRHCGNFPTMAPMMGRGHSSFLWCRLSPWSAPIVFGVEWYPWVGPNW